MAVSEEGRVACDMRYCAFSRQQQQGTRRNTGTSAASLKVRGRSARDAETDAEEREVSALVAHAIEPSVRVETIPKSVVDLNVLTTEDDGSVLAAACVACSVALANSGIELKDLVSACTVVKISGRVVVDPTAAEERIADGGIVLALMPSLNEVTQLHQWGELSQQDISDSMDLCLDGCNRVHSLMKKALVSDI